MEAQSRIPHFEPALMVTPMTIANPYKPNFKTIDSSRLPFQHCPEHHLKDDDVLEYVLQTKATVHASAEHEDKTVMSRQLCHFDRHFPFAAASRTGGMTVSVSGTKTLCLKIYR